MPAVPLTMRQMLLLQAFTISTPAPSAPAPTELTFTNRLGGKTLEEALQGGSVGSQLTVGHGNCAAGCHMFGVDSRAREPWSAMLCSGARCCGHGTPPRSTAAMRMVCCDIECTCGPVVIVPVVWYYCRPSPPQGLQHPAPPLAHCRSRARAHWLADRWPRCGIPAAH